MSDILTVTTAADSYHLTTVATVKAELGIATADQSQDDNLLRWIGQASGTIAAMCKRVFGLETVSQVFRTEVGEINALLLARYPVTAITSVTEDGTVLDTTDYEVDAATGLLYRLDGDEGRQWWPSGSKITVAYSGGYALLDDVPFPLEAAAIELVKMSRVRATRDPTLRVEDIPGVLRTEYWVTNNSAGAPALPPQVFDLIAPYRNIAIR